jgi:hypothetical protein
MNTKIGPRPARAYCAPRARPRFGPKPKTARRPARAHCAPRTRPRCGPKPKIARRPAHAQRVPRSRPQPGLGPGKSRPAWAATRYVRREPSICIRRPRVDSDRTKPALAPSREPYGSFAPSHAAARAPRWRCRGPSHRHARLPMGGRAAVERLLGRAVPE